MIKDRNVAASVVVLSEVRIRTKIKQRDRCARSWVLSLIYLDESGSENTVMRLNHSK